MSGALGTGFLASFAEIPYDWRKPGTYLEVRPNYRNTGLIGFPTKAILLGQMGSDATAAAATSYQITRADQADVLFGAGSQLAGMVQAFHRANPFSEMFAMGLPAAAGAAAATGTLTFDGAGVAGAATVAFYIGGRRVPLIVRPTDTPAQQAATLAGAISADPRLPVSATAAGAVVTLTARQAGELGNAIDLRIGLRADELRPPGFGCTIAPMSGGAGNPDLGTLLARIGGAWYTDIVTGWTDGANLATLTADLAARYTAMGKLDAHGWAGVRGTLGQLLATGDSLNSQFLTAIGAKRAPTPPWEWAASLAGVGVFHLTNDPARQLRTLALPGVLGPAEPDRATPEEQDLLLRNGISTFEVLSDGTVVLDRVVTTYQTSALGVLDAAWLDVTVPKTMTRVRYDWSSYVSLAYPRHKLADDNSVAAGTEDVIATPRRLHNAWAGRCRLYEQLGWIEGAADTSANAVFARDLSDKNRVNARQEVRIIGNLMVLAAALEFQA